MNAHLIHVLEKKVNGNHKIDYDDLFHTELYQGPPRFHETNLLEF